MKRRLSAQPGEWIDRTQPLEFRFEGEKFSGFAGDVIASALLANGVQTMGRSFKYHRRAGVTAWLGTMPTRCLQTASARICAAIASCWLRAWICGRSTPSWAEGDLLKWLEILGRFMPVGFYYKTFHRPGGFFPFTSG